MNSERTPYAEPAVASAHPNPANKPPPRLYFGKYRGKILDNLDPLMLGRVLADVPAVPGSLLNWALPCTPYAGPGVGFYSIPPIGANVWVEYEGGDPTYPVWSGCFWEEGEMPVEPAYPLKKVWKTEFVTVELDDTPAEGGFLIKALPPVAPPDGLTMRFNVEGVKVECLPNSIAMTPLSIKSETPPTTVTLTADTIEVLVPETSITIAGEAIEVTTVDVSVQANVNITGAVEIEGDVNITGAVEVEGDVNVLGAVEIEGDVNVLGAVEVEGNVNVLGALEVEGDVNILGGQQTEGNCAVLGVIEGVVVPPFL